MRHMRRDDRSPTPISVEGAQGVSKAGLVSESDGAPTAAMRLFELAPGGHTPYHAHDWEHVVYVVEGKGELRTENGNASFSTGDALLAEPDEMHNFVNTGDGPLRFLCVVPLRGDK